MAKNLAVKKEERTQGLTVARAAEKVSGELDKVIHERMRLGIISALAANERLSQRRALAVSNILRQSGQIQPGRVLSPSAMGEGTAAPGEAAPTSNEEARRVLVRIVTPKGQLQ